MFPFLSSVHAFKAKQSSALCFHSEIIKGTFINICSYRMKQDALSNTKSFTVFLIIGLENIGARLRQEGKKMSIVPLLFQKVYDNFAHLLFHMTI